MITIIDNGANTNNMNNFGPGFYEYWPSLISKFEFEENFGNQSQNLPKISKN